MVVKQISYWSDLNRFNLVVFISIIVDRRYHKTLEHVKNTQKYKWYKNDVNLLIPWLVLDSLY